MSEMLMSKDRTGSRRDFLQGSASYAGETIVAPVENHVSRVRKSQVTPMRTPDAGAGDTAGLNDFVASFAAASTVPTLPPTGVLVLNKMGFGPRPGDLEAFELLGADDNARIQAYVDQHLNPESLDDSELEEYLSLSGFQTLNKSAALSWQDHVVANPSYSIRIQPYRETERAVFLRAMYSKKQLVEVLADFWHNHFNVYASDFWAGPHWVHYDRDIIRGNMLGNFRDMLEAVAKSVPMLYYLDNYTNTSSGPNENYARELFELHTLGAENYFGVVRQHEVPRDENNVPMGYCDDDVYEATRCLTGWTLNYDTGEFLYNANQHDRFQKSVLGVFIPPDQPPTKDGLDVLNRLATHPGTARYISRKLCRRFIADNPPQRIVDEAAAVFLANSDAPDQLKQVVRTILLSSEFRGTWGQKVKRPFDYIVSCFRSVNADFLFTLDDTVTNYFMYAFEQTGQPPFRWGPPDGYPDRKEHWLGNSTFVMSWRIINWFVEVKDWWDGIFRPFDAIGDTPTSIRSANGIVDFWTNRMLGRPLDPDSRQHIVDFMAAGRDPDFDLPIETNSLFRERVWGTIALIMMSPENLLR